MFRAFAVRLPHVGATIAVLALAACTQPSPPSNQSTKAPAPTYDIVAQIRAAGERDKSAIEVAPLRDPGVTGLQDGASADERAQQYDAAGAKLDSALKIAGDAPDLLQDRAEIAVRLNDNATAERLAHRSYDIGPKLGSLCARNWQTVVEMRTQANDTAGAAAAKQEVAKCHVAGATRFNDPKNFPWTIGFNPSYQLDRDRQAPMGHCSGRQGEQNLCPRRRQRQRVGN